MSSPDIKWVTNFGRLCKIFSSKDESGVSAESASTVNTVYNYVFKKDRSNKNDDVDTDICCELICSEVRMKDCGCKEKISCSCKLVHKFDHFYLISGLDEIVHANLEKFATKASGDASCITIISIFIRKKKSR